jgi:hypothetical protein
VWEETLLVSERNNNLLRTNAVLAKEAVSTAIAQAFGKRGAGSNFSKLLDKLGE